ncbi:hypothetical protein A464_plas0105 (plasmid) [Salmonella bongori N268-08]|uniref:Uncharacterized protein n=1 Tax=Salmonella bongori N268-08 TaxID=1197719 RepID=S5N4Y6_SALBN|nr:hypothetical protein A464_plas0105 [Salmonella bongori N268-08]
MAPLQRTVAKVIRDGNVLMTATLIPVSGLLATHQPQLL